MTSAAAPGHGQPPLVPHLPSRRTFKVIGLGGVGGIVARHLAVFLAAQRENTRLVLIDGDAFEARNGERMLFRSLGNKAAAIADELQEQHALSRLTVQAVEEHVSARNVERLIQAGDALLLCVDNAATRKLVSDRCAGVPDVLLISGGNDGVGPDSGGRRRRGTFGTVQVHVRSAGEDCTPALTRYHPEIARPRDRHPDEQGCGELSASVPQVLFTNLATASAMLSTLYVALCDALPYCELAFDIAEGVQRPLTLGMTTQAAMGRP